MSEKFEDLINHESEHVSRVAKLLLEAKQELEKGNMTKVEFDELAGDMVDMLRVEELSEDLEMRTKVRSAVSILEKIIGSIPL